MQDLALYVLLLAAVGLLLLTPLVYVVVLSERPEPAQRLIELFKALRGARHDEKNHVP